MSDRAKRILMIVGFIVFSGIVAFVIYYVFFRQLVTPPPTTTPGQQPGGTLPGSGPAVPGQGTAPTVPGGLQTAPTVPGAVTAPGAAQAQTSLLLNGVTQQVSPSSDRQSARYYNPEDGKFYRVTPDGVSVALSNQTFPDVQTVNWGNESDQAILTFPDGSKIHYDFRTNEQDTLPQHWNDFTFSPDDRRVVAKSEALSPDARFLIISDPDGSNSKAIEPLGENGDKVFPTWTPNQQIIAYAEVGDPKGFDRQDIILVGQNHENFRALQVEGRGFEPLWSPDGTKVLYSIWSSRTDYRPELWVSGGDPSSINVNRSNLNLITWAHKCTWDGSNALICAVPEELPTGAGLQPDLFTDKPDQFYRINLQNGVKTFLGKPEGVGSTKNLVITADGNNLMFTDVQTGKLYNFLIP